ncbi:hypothetical protein CTR2_R13380 [Comamonas thiooxydans]|uniref:hypothetical protein n=1 Tax=Comamonas thiooxydans TaxID=363952 RepID=UPI000A2D8364|nr:hypothetical protein [Comamonas thiooxydans]BDR08000.1 hypothetical protein CTR2_R13380 [Comamonas thiooxydans]
MATARAMTVLSTQWSILGTQILQRRRSADLASLRSVYDEPALQVEEAMVPRCRAATAYACHALNSEAACALTHSDYDCFIAENDNRIALNALV